MSQFTLNVQQQLPDNLVVQVAYVGGRPTHLEVNHNINILPANLYNLGAAEVTTLTTAVPNNPLHNLVPSNSNANGATIQPQYLDLPYPEFQSVTENYSPIGSTPYNALQIQVTKPMKHRYTVAGNLTWDKLMHHDGYLDNFAAVIGQLDHVEDGAPNFFGTIYGTYELPEFGSMPYYGREALGGWKLNGVMRYSGRSTAWRTRERQHHRQLTSKPELVAPPSSTTPATRTPQDSRFHDTLDKTNTYNTVTACDLTSPNPCLHSAPALYLAVQQQCLEHSSAASPIG